MTAGKGLQGMKVSDYIVDFLAVQGVTDVFGYPSGMVTHLMESFSAQEGRIRAHVNYHEQAAAFAACGYAQASGKLGVAYATSGPGATNLITGIANAWFDSIPVLFLTGQVNTFEAKGELAVRQQGFQETDIVSMVRGITKYCTCVTRCEDIRYELEKAWYQANEGRKGPVLLDIPMDVQRGNVDPEELRSFLPEEQTAAREQELGLSKLQELLDQARKPVLLLGAGVKLAQAGQEVLDLIRLWNVPVISSMLAFDVMERDDCRYFGFIGAYGDRAANFIVAKSDLILSLGSRLDIRQVGAKREDFAPEAALVRVEIDEGELTRKIKEKEWDICCDIRFFLEKVKESGCRPQRSMEDWLSVCRMIREKLIGLDERNPNRLIRRCSEHLPGQIGITADVGQNQVWLAQSFRTKTGQNVFFSGGHGAMGYSLPAAIGVFYGSRRPVVSFNGDGGIQMNLQELQFIVRERLPILIVIVNNASLGMIRHFQEMYFDANYYQTKACGGYTVPDFGKLATAYGIAYCRVDSEEAWDGWEWNGKEPQVIEICLEDTTYVYPKLEYGRPNQDQEPLLDRTLYQDLMELDMLDKKKLVGGGKYPKIKGISPVKRQKSAFPYICSAACFFWWMTMESVRDFHKRRSGHA